MKKILYSIIQDKICEMQSKLVTYTIPHYAFIDHGWQVERALHLSVKFSFIVAEYLTNQQNKHNSDWRLIHSFYTAKRQA